MVGQGLHLVQGLTFDFDGVMGFNLKTATLDLRYRRQG